MKTEKDIQNLLLAFGECLFHAKDIDNKQGVQTFSRSIDILLWVLDDKNLDKRAKELFDALSSKASKKIEDLLEEAKRKKKKKRLRNQKNLSRESRKSNQKHLKSAILIG